MLILIALLLFELEESEAEITEEICTYIRDKKHCIPDEKIDEIVVSMYLNIVEYTYGDKKDELLEMINMMETYDGLISQIRNEGKTKWINKGKRDIIQKLLETFSSDVVADLLDMDKCEIDELVGK